MPITITLSDDEIRRIRTARRHSDRADIPRPIWLALEVIGDRLDEAGAGAIDDTRTITGCPACAVDGGTGFRRGHTFDDHCNARRPATAGRARNLPTAGHQFTDSPGFGNFV